MLLDLVAEIKKLQGQNCNLAQVDSKRDSTSFSSVIPSLRQRKKGHRDKYQGWLFAADTRTGCGGARWLYAFFAGYPCDFRCFPLFVAGGDDEGGLGRLGAVVGGRDSGAWIVAGRRAVVGCGGAEERWLAKMVML